jgi:Golgi phosphoprotein 3
MKHDELNIAEQLLLLGLEDRKGTLSWRASAWFDYGLAGACLAELYRVGAIAVGKDGETIVVEGQPEPKSPVLCAVLAKLKETPGVSPRAWAATLPNSLELVHDLAEELVRKNVLERHEGRVLFLFHRTTYPMCDATPEKDLTDAIRAAFRTNDEVPGRLASLIAIANAAAVLPPLDESVDEETRARRLAAFAQASPVASAAVDAIAEAMKAVSIASSVSMLPP